MGQCLDSTKEAEVIAMEKKKAKLNPDKIALELSRWSKSWVRKNWGGKTDDVDRDAIYLITGTAEAEEGFLQNRYPGLSYTKSIIIMKKAVKLLKEKKV
jgi:hypothetical protein